MGVLGKLYRQLAAWDQRGILTDRLALAVQFVKDRESYRFQRQWIEHTRSLGKEHPDKVFHIIRKYPKATGLLSCYLSALGQLEELSPKLAKGNHIPVMDAQSALYPLLHDQGDVAGEKNAWDYYFENFSNYTLEDTANARYVHFCRGYTVPAGMVFFDNTRIDRELIWKWTPLHQKYFHLIPSLQQRFERSYEQLLSGKRVLGTMIREGYMVLAYSRDHADAAYKEHPGIGGHPVQPGLEELCAELKKRMTQWNCDYLFVVAETHNTVEYLRRQLGDKIITTSRIRRNVKDPSMQAYVDAEKEFPADYTMVKNNEQYLEEIYLLSKCNCISAGKCSGSVVAALWNAGAYEEMEIMQRGLY